ncbi:hypothetical protein ACFQ51_24735 [Streptomyces kaempferi]
MTQPASSPPEYPQYPAPPQSPVPPPYPGQQPPSYSGQQPPPYPGEQPPAYPGQQPPSYPGQHSQAPHHPQPPRYPQAAAPPSQPAYPHAATLPAPAPPLSPGDPAHPHHISTDHGRVHIRSQQRRTDSTAVGNLLLHLPNFLCSLFVVGLFSAFFGDLGFLVVLAWLASGALVFHRPTESAIARRLLRLRYPTPQERAKLEPVWHEVTARAGVEGRTYELWVEDSDGLNAVAAAATSSASPASP